MRRILKSTGEVSGRVLTYLMRSEASLAHSHFTVVAGKHSATVIIDDQGRIMTEIEAVTTAPPAVNSSF